MIKRTTEKLLTWIGVGLQVIVVLFWAFLAILIGANSGEIETALLEDGTTTVEEAQFIMMMYHFIVNFALIFGIIALIVAIIAGVMMNKKVKLAGILLIIAGVISIFYSISGILWLVAGIMLLVRKPVPTNSQQMTSYTPSNANHSVNPDASHHVENYNPVNRQAQQHSPRTENDKAGQGHEMNNAESREDAHFRSDAEAQRSKDIQQDPYKY
ncbi:DUF4064 domain-containing protein [Staphylococcus hyicus]|uniref:DUF4064 domain-containing protein n=1 Tax=Staphylococcus hyicus TaxID=1284 RepID=UPI00208DDFF7|nr:DUF4064 domain-containing protein [Staphylococcus hyicus]MCO4330592.1 DUF4064 domain-containing protein [Staphylococcus hyicus]MCO4332990.1 DUF4064 domain-containing protein [Staphylococcus hyicus]